MSQSFEFPRQVLYLAASFLSPCLCPSLLYFAVTDEPSPTVCPLLKTGARSTMASLPSRTAPAGVGVDGTANRLGRLSWRSILTPPPEAAMLPSLPISPAASPGKEESEVMDVFPGAAADSGVDVVPSVSGGMAPAAEATLPRRNAFGSGQGQRLFSACPGCRVQGELCFRCKYAR